MMTRNVVLYTSPLLLRPRESKDRQLLLLDTIKEGDMKQPNAEVAARTRLRHRRIAVALSLAVALGVPAAYFAPLVLQYAEGTSAEKAIEWANARALGHFTYSLESERVDDEGTVTYSLKSNTDTVVHMELRYEFRWLPEFRSQSGPMVILPGPEVYRPGSYYELMNEDEYWESFYEWRSEYMNSRDDTEYRGRHSESDFAAEAVEFGA